jgi:dihydrofolate reductase
MAALRVHNISMSVDGFVAGPDQSLDDPLGVGGEALHTWVFATRTAQQVHGIGEAGETGVDDDFIAKGDAGIGATIIGRNMFGPVRGDWGDDSWKGWWGDNPPYHHPVFVLTHHAHDPIEMSGGTTFHFVTDGIESALRKAYEAADGADVRVGGGASTIRQYLRAGLVDEMHVAIVPVLLREGERLFDADGDMAGYVCTNIVSSPAVSHALFVRER